MRKVLLSFLLGVSFVALTACGVAEQNIGGDTSISASVNGNTVGTKNETPEKVTITSLNANREKIQLEVPYDPQRVAILDLAALDIIDHLGVGDRVVGTADSTIEYLLNYTEDENIAKLGTIKEADMEAVMECEPDVIFIGGRLATSYDALSEIAPVVFLSTDLELGLVESVKQNTMTIASLFGMEAAVNEQLLGYEERIAALSEIAEGKTALIGMVTSGSFNLLGNQGRCSLIGNEIGFTNLVEDAPNSQNPESAKESGTSQTLSPSHGNESSFEVVVAKNPEYIFVLDRDSAIGTAGAQLAEDVMENELIQGTSAYQNGNLVHLENSGIWYTVEGGITALDIMLEDLEKSLLD